MTDGLATRVDAPSPEPARARPPTDRAAEPGAPARRPTGVRRRWPGVVSLGLYALCSTLLYGGYSWTSSTQITGCACGDQVQEVWFLAWPSYALTHGHNLFVTTWMNYPKGVNLATNTSLHSST